MNRWLLDLRRDAADDAERGSVTVWMIGVVVSTFLMVGLLLDGGSMLRRRSEVFGIASSAARAGAQQLDEVQAVEGTAVLDPVAAERAALAYLTDRGLSGSVAVEGDTVTVEVNAVAELQMLNLVGGNGVSFTATASAQAVKVAL